MAANTHIDSDQEHLQVLFALGLLDDMDNWPLFQAQEARFNAVDDSISVAQWRRYVRPTLGTTGTDPVESLDAPGAWHWMGIQEKRLKALPQRPEPRI